MPQREEATRVKVMALTELDRGSELDSSGNIVRTLRRGEELFPGV